MYFSKKFFSIILITCMLISIVCTIVFAKMIQPEESIATTWKFQSIDTMKYSRDHAKDETIKDEIPLFVKQIADMKATHIAIATPYDEEFYPFLSTWVSEARKYHLKIWFRGNVSGWEGWFGYKKISDPQEHHALIRDFILKHQDIFESGDIFTPAPEAENGGFGDPRGSLEKSQKFNQFLIDSYTNCKESFIVIHKNVQ